MKKISERLSDKIANFAGTWTFILIFTLCLIGWIYFNCELSPHETFDPYPFILLNLFLSCLAAIQAPIILMAQNRQAKKDREKLKKHFETSLEIKNKISKIERSKNEG